MLNKNWKILDKIYLYFYGNISEKPNFTQVWINGEDLNVEICLVRRCDPRQIDLRSERERVSNVDLVLTPGHACHFSHRDHNVLQGGAGLMDIFNKKMLKCMYM